jgi:hypothetical protein
MAKVTNIYEENQSRGEKSTFGQINKKTYNNTWSKCKIYYKYMNEIIEKSAHGPGSSGVRFPSHTRLTTLMW